MRLPKFMTRLMSKWQITSLWDFTVIMLVFSLAGMTIVYERKPIFHYLGITADTPFTIKFVAWLLIVFPCYQLNLIVFGSLLGQFRFFWKKEKQMARFFWKIITGQRSGSTGR